MASHDEDEGRATPEVARSIAQHLNLFKHDLRRAVSGATAFIHNHERVHGGFFFQTEAEESYFFDGKEKRIHRLVIDKNRSSSFCKLLARRYNLRASDRIAQLVIDALVADCSTTAKRRVHRWSYYDRERRHLYLSNYNGRMFRVSGNGVSNVQNGTQGVFFADDDDGEPVDPIIDDHQMFRPALVDGVNFVAGHGGITPDQQRLLLDLWIHCLPFGEIIKSIPLTIFNGEQGSGKTVAVQMIKRIVHGNPDPYALPKKANEEDLSVLLLRSPITLLDNIDSYIDWVPDAVAGYVTGTASVRRKRFTDAEQSKIKSHSFIAVTSRNPTTFYRDDVVSRLLLFRMETRTENRSESRIFGELAEQRAKLYGEYLAMLSWILARMDDLEQIDEPRYRMADFTNLLIHIGLCLGYEREQIDEALRMQQVERDYFSVENDALTELLLQWIASDGYRKKYIGQRLSIPSLHKTLTGFGSMVGSVTYPFRTPQALEQHLRRKWAGITRRMSVSMERLADETILVFNPGQQVPDETPNVIPISGRHG